MMQSLSDPSQIDEWKHYMREYQATKRHGAGATEVGKASN